MDAEGRMSDTPKPKVRVKALQMHSAQGNDYELGDEYEVDAELVDTLKVQGKAVPVEEAPPPPVEEAPPV